MSLIRKDIVIDTNVIRLYDTPANADLKVFFLWLHKTGTLVVTQKLLVEYIAIGNKLLAPLIDQLIKQNRFVKLSKQELITFKEDRHFNYTCNGKDIWHARAVFLSTRKRLVAGDKKLVKDVNRFRKISGIKPVATLYPSPSFYE